MRVYLVIAYRFGRTNAHTYTVWGGTCRSTAWAFAIKEGTERGGKYGCAVYEIDGEDEQLVDYYPSSYGEEKPSQNANIVLCQNMGTYVVRCLEGYGSQDDLSLVSLTKRLAYEKQVAEIQCGHS